LPVFGQLLFLSPPLASYLSRYIQSSAFWRNYFFNETNCRSIAEFQGAEGKDLSRLPFLGGDRRNGGLAVFRFS
jgi:hypothetical protein